jgi:hypothetical protein
MHIAGQHRLAAPQRRVWEALHDPHILALATQGGGVERLSDTEFRVGAPLSTILRITESAPVERLKLVAEHGAGTLELTAIDASSTMLAYGIDGEMTDESAARAAIARFVEVLQGEIAGPAERAAEAPTAALAASLPRQGGMPEIPSKIGGLPTVFWLGAIVFVLIVGSILTAYI